MQMMIGGAIMIIGVIIQVSAVKGHKAMAQFIIGRTITGVGNGIVSFLLISHQPCTNRYRTLLQSPPTKPSAVDPPTEDC